MGINLCQPLMSWSVSYGNEPSKSNSNVLNINRQWSIPLRRGRPKRTDVMKEDIQEVGTRE